MPPIPPVDHASSRGEADGAQRFNLLLSYGGWRDESWADLLPRLLEPMGVRSWRADSGVEAEKLLKHVPVHVAVIDMGLPLDPQDPSCDEPAGYRLLQIMARLPQRPPTLVVKRRRTRREETRDVASALQAGAFAVIERPVDLETMLQTMQRVLIRHYAGRWPCDGGAGGSGGVGGGASDA